MSIRERLGAKTPEEAIPYINFLVYGEPGAGKTFLAGTAAYHEETSPVLILDIDGGALTLRKVPNVEVIQVRSMGQLEKICNELAKDNDFYKTVVLDTITEMQKLDMTTVMKEQFSRKPETTDIFVPSQREWGKSGERVRMVIRAYRDLPVHTIVTAHSVDIKDERTNKTSYHPSLPGKLRNEIPGFFDIVGRLTTFEEKGDDNAITIRRQIQFAKTTAVSAKDRTDSLGDLMRNPTVPLMWDMIQMNPTEIDRRGTLTEEVEKTLSETLAEENTNE